MTQELGSQEHKVNVFVEVLKVLQESIWRERLDRFPDKWIYHLDNDLVRDALGVLAKKCIIKIDHSPK